MAEAQAAQERQLQNVRKIVSRAPGFNPNVTAWRTFRSTYTSWSNMSGISAMGEVGAPAAHIEFTKLCLESAMEGTAVTRVEQFRVGTAAAAACATFNDYLVLLESIFQPPQQSRALQQEFKSYKQSKDDDASTYLSSKCALYDVAYAATRP